MIFCSAVNNSCLDNISFFISLFFTSSNISKSKSKLCYDRQSVGQSVLVSSTRLGPKTTFLLLSVSCEFVHEGRSLWREDGSVVYNCCWSSPEQSFPGPSPVFYYLRFEIVRTWRFRSAYLYPPGRGWPSCTSRPWVPFSSPLTTSRATVEIFEPASTRGLDNWQLEFSYL
jgi:hypothetical protein